MGDRDGGGDSDLLFLSCDEKIDDSSSSGSGSGSIHASVSSHPDLHLLDGAIGMDRQGEEESLRNLACRQPDHSPGTQYRCNLKSQHLVSAARSNAVDWMIKVRNVYGFRSATVALSVIYLDRYLAKEIRHKVWKAWMIELLSIACLSLAAKMEETFVPLLQELQIEGLDHLFEDVTIQRMEVSVMKVLDWRLNSATAFTFAGGFLRMLELQHHLTVLTWKRIEELVLGTLSETAFLDFPPSVVAMAAMVCALEEIVPVQANDLKRLLLEMLLVDEASFEKCYRVVEELVVDPICPVPSWSQVLVTSQKPCSSSECETECNASRKRSRVEVAGGGGDTASKKSRSSE